MGQPLEKQSSRHHQARWGAHHQQSRFGEPWISSKLCHMCFPTATLSLGTQVEALHSSLFAFNCRVLETRLHRALQHSNNRLWSKIGAGSYYLSASAIQVSG
jgi:hypothetical protein